MQEIIKILFVAYLNELNRTILDLLSAHQNYEVETCTPDILEKNFDKYNKTSWNILIADITTSTEKPVDTIKKLSRYNLSQYLLAIHVYTSKSLIEPLLNSGADGYLSTNTTEQEITTAINELSNGNRYPDI